MRIRHGLPPELREDAARLYWQAFGGKLGRIFGPEDRAIVFLKRVIRSDHCIHAVDDEGNLIGIAGFKSRDGSFAGGSNDDLRHVFGAFGSYWRRLVLGLLQKEIDNERFLIDGICVSREWQGHGVGSALIDALVAEARWRGYGSVRLEVIDRNIRARALYERLGFLPWRSEAIGPLRHVFGFDRATTMVRELVRPAS